MDIRYDEGENMKRVLSYIFGAVWCVCIILLALNSSTETVKLSDKAFENRLYNIVGYTFSAFSLYIFNKVKNGGGL